MGVVTRSKKRKLEEVDHISGLPDGVLGDIVSLLPTQDGARTQVLSSRWRHIWRAAPLNLDPVELAADKYSMCERVSAREISRILSAHQGPGRRFCTELQYLTLHGRPAAAILDGWLRSAALDNLVELRFHYGYRFPRGFSPLPPPPPMPASVRRFSPTLRVASFAGCVLPAEENAAAAVLHFPVLKQLSLLHATFSESSLQALLAGCPVLQSLLLSYNCGYSVIRIVSRTLISIGVDPASPVLTPDHKSQQLILEDVPCLEKFLLLSTGCSLWPMAVSVVSAPKLSILGPLSGGVAMADFGATIVQGPRSFIREAPSVKILALLVDHNSFDVVINFMKYFPCLEKLYIELEKILSARKNGLIREHMNLVRTLDDIRLKKVVLLNYRGNKSHVNFAKFFVLNARVLDSMVLKLQKGMILSTEWIERQHKSLHTKNRVSRGAQFDFVCHDGRSELFDTMDDAQVHDLSTADPFVMFHARSL